MFHAEFAAIAVAHNIRKMISKGYYVCSEVAVGYVWLAWPPSAVLEGGARDEVVGGMKSELVPTNQAKLTLPPLSSYPYKHERR